jgi:hypothetical protein
VTGLVLAAGTVAVTEAAAATAAVALGAGAGVVAATKIALDGAAVLLEHKGRLLDWIDDGLHGNNSKSTRPTVGYSLRDATSGEVMKIGQSSNPGGRYPKRWLKNNNLIMQAENVGTKSEMLKWERDGISEYKRTHGGNRPPLNENDRD